jgi:very-short-patch-repair endonuclease
MHLEGLIDGIRLSASFPLDPHAPFTLAHAKAAGLSPRQLRLLVEQGFLRRPIRSVYVATEIGDSLLLRADCLRLVVPSDAVVVDRHAGWLHGASMVLRPGEHLQLRPVSVFMPPGRRLRNVLADSGERRLRPDEVTEVAGLRVTTPLRTACDLGRSRWPDNAIAALDAMLRLGHFARGELEQSVPRFRGMRWVTTLRALAPLADGRSESPGESVLRLRCIEAQLDRMVPQVEVHRGDVLVARLDLADEELEFAVEYDGAEWHSSPEQQAHDQRRRQAAEDEGWLIKPFTKEQVFGHHRTIDELLVLAAREARARRGLRVHW